MRKLLRIVIVILLGFELSGCAWMRRGASRGKSEQPQQAAVPRLVGTIALVDAGAGFVLIDNGSQIAPPTGAALKSFSGETETAVLAVGTVRRRPFVIADIVKGEPRKGDLVYQ